MGEGTAARIFKGSTREVVYRCASSLIHLLSCDETSTVGYGKDADAIKSNGITDVRPSRNAKRKASNRIRSMIADGSA